MRTIGILGGTFNPIHYGHLRMAQELGESLALDEVRFIPSAIPPHKTLPNVSAVQRAALVELAIEDNATFKLDMRELDRSGPSYTIDTLISLRHESDPETSLVLFMGTDAFRQLDSWHRWQELLDYCHIALVQRPQPVNVPLSKPLETYLSEHYSEHPADLHKHPSGFITMQQITALDISSTAIRARLQQGLSTRYLMPDNVIHYLQAHGLYQGNVQ
jgi:nicotinate-nucleotide adenylyltransferase